MGDVRANQILRIREYVNRRLQNKPVIRPYFIIKFGPPASGKTTVINDVYKRVLHIKPKDVVDVDVDEMVVELTNMDVALRNLMATHSVSETAEELHEHLQHAATNIYFQERGYVEDLADKMMLDAIMAHKHVSVETIGKSAEKWRTLLAQIRGHGYITVVVYPYVVSQTLKERLLARNVRQLRKLRWAQVHPMITAAQNTFVELVPLVDMALMIDNTKAKPVTVVDVVNNQAKCQLSCYVPDDSDMTEELRQLIRNLCARCKGTAKASSRSNLFKHSKGRTFSAQNKKSGGSTHNKKSGGSGSGGCWPRWPRWRSAGWEDPEFEGRQYVR